MLSVALGPSAVWSTLSKLPIKHRKQKELHNLYSIQIKPFIYMHFKLHTDYILYFLFKICTRICVKLQAYHVNWYIQFALYFHKTNIYGQFAYNKMHIVCIQTLTGFNMYIITAASCQYIKIYVLQVHQIRDVLEAVFPKPIYRCSIMQCPIFQHTLTSCQEHCVLSVGV